MLKLSKVLLCGALCAAVSAAEGLTLSQEILESSTGAVVPGEWNRNFDAARKAADAEKIPMVVFFGGLSCGACETLQRACLTDEFTAWQRKKKLIMVFTTDNRLGAASSFAKPEEGGYPYIAVYWNQDGRIPEKNTAYYRTFTGRAGEMPVKGGTLANQFIKSIELVAGAYPYAGGEFLLPDGVSARLEVEVGYPAGRKVVVPLVRTATGERYTNRLVCGSKTNDVDWAENETRKYSEVEMPAGIAEGGSVKLELLSYDGQVRSISSIAVVGKQGNSLSNPAWLGEPFNSGEWTMDYDSALKRAKDGEFDYTILYFSGVLWCPYCQGLEDGVLKKSEFTEWCKEKKIALVEFDNPRRSDSKPAADYLVESASGAPPTLLRYEIGKNSYRNREESGASYLTRKGIVPGDALSAGTAEFVLQRNRRLGYEWGEGSYCAPGAGRTGYPTMILLNADGTIAGRLNLFEHGKAFEHPFPENMARLDELLKLAGGEGESSCYWQTTELELEPGGSAQTASLQINAAGRYFRLKNICAGRVAFTSAGGKADNPVFLSVVRLDSGKATVVKEAEGSVVCDLDGKSDYFLKVEAFRENREYGRDTLTAVNISSSVVLVPTEKTQSFTPEGKKTGIYLTAGKRYRIDGLADPTPEALIDDGPAMDGGRYYVAAKDAIAAVSSASTIEYQIWEPGTVAFDTPELVVFEFEKKCEISVSRVGGSSGNVAVNVRVAGGTAVNGVRYAWDDDVTLEWKDGEAGSRKVVCELKDTGRLEPNQSFVLQLKAVSGSASAAVSQGVCEVVLSDIDTPVLPKQSYQISMFATLDAASALEAQSAYNVQPGKVSLKKVSGRLPSGVKLIYADGKVMLSGAASKPGEYEYSFRMEQRQNGKNVSGPVITIKFNVHSAGDVSSGGIAFLNRALKTALPLYGEENGVMVLKGLVEFTSTAKNKLSVKYTGLEKKSVSFKGKWMELEDGCAYAEMESKGKTLDLTLDGKGSMSARYRDPESGVELHSAEPLRIASAEEALSLAGKYTMSFTETGTDVPAGCSYVYVKSVSSAGKVSWAGVLGNGQAVSDTSYVMFNEEGYAVLPIFCRKSKDYLAAALLLKPYSFEDSYPRAVKLVEGSIARWEHFVEPVSRHDCEVRGSWYDASASLQELCRSQFAETRLRFYSLNDGWSSFRYGNVLGVPSGVEVDVLEKGFALVEKNKDLKLKYTRSTGVFSGSMKVQFEGRKVTATFKGVVLPGWHDCGCEMIIPEDPFKLDVSLPFAVGAAWITDKKDGKSVKRGFPVVIDAGND